MQSRINKIYFTIVAMTVFSFAAQCVSAWARDVDCGRDTIAASVDAQRTVNEQNERVHEIVPWSVDDNNGVEPVYVPSFASGKEIAGRSYSFSYRDPRDGFEGVDYQHVICAVTRLVDRNISDDVLRAVSAMLSLRIEGVSSDALYDGVWNALADGYMSKDVIDAINGDAYEDPRPEVEIYGQHSDARAQSVCEAVSNSLDALGAKIGRFGKGIKELIRWLEPNGLDRIDVFTCQSGGVPYHLVMKYAENGQLYISVNRVSPERFAKEAGHGNTYGTVVQAAVREKIPVSTQDVTNERMHSQEGLIARVRERFAFVSSAHVYTKQGQNEFIMINGFDRKEVVVPAESVLRHADGTKQVYVSVSDYAIRIVDNGAGMDAEMVTRMFIPKEGNKKLEQLDMTAAWDELAHVMVVQDRTLPQGVMFSRNEEGIQTISWDESIVPEALCEGMLMIDGARLFDVRESRDGIKIPLPQKTGEDTPFSLALTSIVDQVIASERDNTEKVRIINTVVTGLYAIAGSNKQEQEIVKNMCKEVQKKVHPLVEILRENGYVFLPHEKVFQKIQMPNDTKVLFVNEHLMDWHGAYSLKKYFGADCIDTDNNRKIVIMPFTDESLACVRGVTSEWHVLTQEHLLPLINKREDGYFVIPAQLGGRYFMELYAKRQTGLNEQEKNDFETLVELINIATADVVKTGYDITTPESSIEIAAQVSIPTSVGQIDSETVNDFLTDMSHLDSAQVVEEQQPTQYYYMTDDYEVCDVRSNTRYAIPPLRVEIAGSQLSARELDGAGGDVSFEQLRDRHFTIRFEWNGKQYFNVFHIDDVGEVQFLNAQFASGSVVKNNFMEFRGFTGSASFIYHFETQKRYYFNPADMMLEHIPSDFNTMEDMTVSRDGRFLVFRRGTYIHVFDMNDCGGDALCPILSIAVAEYDMVSCLMHRHENLLMLIMERNVIIDEKVYDLDARVSTGSSHAFINTVSPKQMGGIGHYWSPNGAVVICGPRETYFRGDSTVCTDFDWTNGAVMCVLHDGSIVLSNNAERIGAGFAMYGYMDAHRVWHHDKLLFVSKENGVVFKLDMETLEFTNAMLDGMSDEEREQDTLGVLYNMLGWQMRVDMRIDEWEKLIYKHPDFDLLIGESVDDSEPDAYVCKIPSGEYVSVNGTVKGYERGKLIWQDTHGYYYFYDFETNEQGPPFEDAAQCVAFDGRYALFIDRSSGDIVGAGDTETSTHRDADDARALFFGEVPDTAGITVCTDEDVRVKAYRDGTLKRIMLVHDFAFQTGLKMAQGAVSVEQVYGNNDFIVAQVVYNDGRIAYAMVNDTQEGMPDAAMIVVSQSGRYTVHESFDGVISIYDHENRTKTLPYLPDYHLVGASGRADVFFFRDEVGRYAAYRLDGEGGYEGLYGGYACAIDASGSLLIGVGNDGSMTCVRIKDNEVIDGLAGHRADVVYTASFGDMIYIRQLGVYGDIVTILDRESGMVFDRVTVDWDNVRENDTFSELANYRVVLSGNVEAGMGTYTELFADRRCALPRLWTRHDHTGVQQVRLVGEEYGLGSLQQYYVSDDRDAVDAQLYGMFSVDRLKMAGEKHDVLVVHAFDPNTGEGIVFKDTREVFRADRIMHADDGCVVFKRDDGTFRILYRSDPANYIDTYADVWSCDPVSQFVFAATDELNVRKYVMIDRQGTRYDVTDIVESVVREHLIHIGLPHDHPAPPRIAFISACKQGGFLFEGSAGATESMFFIDPEKLADYIKAGGDDIRTDTGTYAEARNAWIQAVHMPEGDSLRDQMITRMRDAYLPFIATVPEEYLAASEQEIQLTIREYYEGIEEEIIAAFNQQKDTVRDGVHMDLSSCVKVKKFEDRMERVMMVLPAFMRSFIDDIAQESLSVRRQMFDIFVVNVCDGLFGDFFDEHAVTEELLYLFALGWSESAVSSEAYDTVPALYELIEATKEAQSGVISYTAISGMIRELNFAVHFEGKSAVTVRRQIEKLLGKKLAVRERVLRQMLKVFAAVNEGGFVAQSHARAFTNFFVNDADFVRNKGRVIPQGKDWQMPEAGVQISQVIQLEKRRDKSHDAEGQVVMTMDYFKDAVAQDVRGEKPLPHVYPVYEDRIMQDVRGQREMGAYTAEIPQNSYDGTRGHEAGEVVIDFYRDTDALTGEEIFVEEAADNGTGALQEVALLIPKSTKATGEQIDLTGFFGTGKYTIFEGVERVEIITKNHARGYMYVFDVEKGADEQPRSVRLVQVREIDDDRIGEGVTVRRIKTVANTVPEIDVLLAREAWRMFAGLSQTESFAIYFVNEEGEKERMSIQKEILAETHFIAPDSKTKELKDFGMLRLISSKDLPRQIVDKIGLRTRDIPSSYLALVPKQFYPAIRELDLVMQIPLPLIRGRDGFQDEAMYVPYIQKYVAISLYKALAYKALTQLDPQFVFAGYPIDWERNLHYTMNFNDDAVLFLAQRINTGDSTRGYSDIETRELMDLLPVRDQVDIQAKAFQLIALLDVGIEVDGVSVTTSLLARRMAVQQDIRHKEHERLLARAGSRARTGTENFGKFPVHRFVKHVEREVNYNKSPEEMMVPFVELSDNEKTLLFLAKRIFKALFGVTEVYIAESEAPFAGMVCSYHGQNALFVNRSMGARAVAGQISNITHEGAHIVEEIMYSNGTELEELIRQGFVAHKSSFTHDVKEGPFARAFRYTATLVLSLLYGDDTGLGNSDAFDLERSIFEAA